MKFGRPEIGKVVHYLPDKKSARAPALASVRIAPKIGHGQVIYLERPKFHPNPFTSGGVIAERVNVVQTRHKVFPILGEASASSPSKNRPYAASTKRTCLSRFFLIPMVQYIKFDVLCSATCFDAVHNDAPCPLF